MPMATPPSTKRTVGPTRTGFGCDKNSHPKRSVGTPVGDAVGNADGALVGACVGDDVFRASRNVGGAVGPAAKPKKRMHSASHAHAPRTHATATARAAFDGQSWFVRHGNTAAEADTGSIQPVDGDGGASFVGDGGASFAAASAAAAAAANDRCIGAPVTTSAAAQPPHALASTGCVVAPAYIMHTGPTQP